MWRRKAGSDRLSPAHSHSQRSARKAAIEERNNTSTARLFLDAIRLEVDDHGIDVGKCLHRRHPAKGKPARKAGRMPNLLGITQRLDTVPARRIEATFLEEGRTRGVNAASVDKIYQA